MVNSISRRRALTGMSGLVAATLAMPHIARAAARSVRLGQNNTELSHYGRGCTAFAAAVAADPVLSGVLTIQIHGNAELGDELGMLRATIDSTLDLLLCSGSVLGNVAPEAGLLDTPFLFRDVAHARAALDGAIGEEYAAVLGSKGVQVLAWSENGLRHITANRPIREPADLQGLKIRVPQSEVMMGGLKALGADVAPLSFTLLREALSTGQFQAQENPIVVIEAAKLYELQKYVSLTGHIYDPAIFAASPDLLEDLTPPQRAALISCAKKGAATTRDVAAKAQEEGIGRLKAAGMIVVEDVNGPAFRAAGQPFFNTLANRYGADRMQRLITAGA